MVIIIAASFPLPRYSDTCYSGVLSADFYGLFLFLVTRFLSISLAWFKQLELKAAFSIFSPSVFRLNCLISSINSGMRYFQYETVL
jgi:hypothetical protein